MPCNNHLLMFSYLKFCSNYIFHYLHHIYQTDIFKYINTNTYYTSPYIETNKTLSNIHTQIKPHNHQPKTTHPYTTHPYTTHHSPPLDYTPRSCKKLHKLHMNYSTHRKVIPKINSITLKHFDSTYKIIHELGAGSFGQVLNAKSNKPKHLLNTKKELFHNTLLSPTSESGANKSPLVAIKIMKSSVSSVADLVMDKELNFICSMPCHPCLIQVYDIFIDPKLLKIHIVMELMNLNLTQLAIARKSTKFSGSTLKSIISQILNGIKHIHNNGFFHRDLKPENILVIPTVQYYGTKAAIPPSRSNDNYIVKVADYGLSRQVDNKSPYTSYISTRWYRAPEILLRKPHYSRPVDMWSFGLIVAELINFSPLFDGHSEFDQLAKILRCLGSPTLPDISNTLRKSVYKVPIGGFWKEGQELASALGIKFPYTEGYNMSQIIPLNPEYEGIEQVLKSCLTWDPNSRSTVAMASSMQYFKGTCVYEKWSPPISHNPYSRANYPSEKLSPSLLKYSEFEDGYANHFQYMTDEMPLVFPILLELSSSEDLDPVDLQITSDVLWDEKTRPDINPIIYNDQFNMF